MVNSIYINDVKIGNNRRFVDVSINGVTIKMQADTGADVTVIGLFTWKFLGSAILGECNWQIYNADGTKIHHYRFF